MATKTITVEATLFGEVEFVMTYEYTPFRPGRFSGPPEDCYPDEPEELEIESIEHISSILPDGNLMNILEDDFIEHLEDRLLDAIHDDFVDIEPSDICVDYDPEDAP